MHLVEFRKFADSTTLPDAVSDINRQVLDFLVEHKLSLMEVKILEVVVPDCRNYYVIATVFYS